jgi:hypothetical protein
MFTRFQTIFSILLLMLSLPLCAQDADTPAAPVPRTNEQAEAQRQKAEDMRKEAKQRYTEDEAACHQKILVSGCLVDAKKRYSNTIIEARKLEAPAREFQRESRRKEVMTEKDQRATERSVREARQQEQAESYRASESAKAAEREQKQLDKERKAEEYRKKQAEKQAERQLKEEKRAKKQAERLEKKAKKQARAEKKAAEKAAGEAGENKE